jgi:hypothetical protein
VIGRSDHPGLRGLALQLVEAALPSITDLTSPRAWAFILLGIHEYLKRYAGDRTASNLREVLADRLMECWRAHSTADWTWFEDRLTYCNATLPHALLLSGHAMGRDDMVETGLDALAWLADLQTTPLPIFSVPKKADGGTSTPLATNGHSTQVPEKRTQQPRALPAHAAKKQADGVPQVGHFVPIGSNGFYARGGSRARFDQQPVEAHAMVSACLAAQSLTGDSKWGRQAHLAFDWFLGHNDLQLSLYDPATGGCRDGLHSDRLNLNEGAESTLAFLLALLEIRVAESLTSALEQPERLPN